MKKLLIDEERTRGFPEYCHQLKLAKAGDVRLQTLLLKQGRLSAGQLGLIRSKRRRATLQALLICAILILASGSCVSAAESASRVLIAQDDAAKAGQNPRRPDADRDCLAWTDTCVNCRREKPGDSFVCSNIGTSCQPKEVTCTSRADPAPTNPAPK